jgi:hypothetical protein
VTAKTGLVCRLAVISAETAGTGGDRQELTSARRLLWGPEYATMPDTARIEVEGQRWNIRSGTVTPIYTGLGAARALEHWHAEVERAR